MIEIKKLTDGDEKNISLKSGEMCYVAREGDRVLGSCVFVFDGEAVRLVSLETTEKSFAIADGLARSAVASLSELAQFVVIDGNGEELTKFRDACGFFTDNRTKIENFFKTCC